MKLGTIIVRIEGVAVATGEVCRRVCNLALAEAGMDYEIGAETFVYTFGHHVTREAFLAFAGRELYPRKQTADLKTLFEVTYKRLRSTADDALCAAQLDRGDGVAEMLVEARQQGISVVFVTALAPKTAAAVLAGALGASFDAGAMPIFSQRDVTPPLSAEEVLGRASAGVAASGKRMIVLESSSLGLAAAEAAGLPAVAVIGGSALGDGIHGARAVVDRLPDLAREDQPAEGHIEGARLISALEALAAQERSTATRDRRNIMQVHHILKDKGAAVKSLAPTDSVQFLAKRLFEEKVGALVVISEQGVLDGIVSERDLTRGLATHGCDVLEMPVTSIMTRAVITCSPADSLYGVAKVMTKRRIRHLPVSEGGRLVGLVSIGDVLSSRLEEVQLEADVLRDYTIALK